MVSNNGRFGQIPRGVGVFENLTFFLLDNLGLIRISKVDGENGH